MDNSTSDKVRQYIEVRQSVAILIFQILVLELLWMVVHVFLVRLLTYFGLHHALFGGLDVQTWELIVFHSINTFLILIITLKWVSIFYGINSKEITCSTGVINKQRKSYEILGIQEIVVSRSFLGRIFGFGTIRLENPLIKSCIYLKNLSKPEFYADLIREEREILLKNQVREKIIPARNVESK